MCLLGDLESLLPVSGSRVALTLPRHCRATAPGCLIRKGRRVRLPNKFLTLSLLL
jgi:hypothetical protein